MKKIGLLPGLLALALLLTACGTKAQESGPAQAGVYDGKLSEEPDRDVHSPAAEPQTVEDPVSGYCGNTVTEVVLDGETYSFWGDDSVVLTDILINLDYADGICRCLPEFTVNTEFGDGYGVNLTEFYARQGDRQASLTEEQAEKIQGILDRNCPGDG